MKRSFILLTTMACCVACNRPKQTEATAENDSTIIHTDTVVQESYIETAASVTIADSAANVDELITENGKSVYLSSHQFSFISDPYDFSLTTSTIEGLLGEKAETKSQDFEGGEDYGPYSYYTITFEDTEISFYDYSGKHFSNITTPLLPLRNGIKIGMKKPNFQTAMGFTDANASQATVYRLTDDYGEMDFFFRADTLYLIYARYEEGD
jgi:hypothetical protein